jgi:hypothetical protein
MDKDPVKDELQTALQDAGLFGKGKMKIVATLANVAVGTVDALFWGATKRPQNATVEGLLRAAGYERQIVKVRVIKDLDKELAEARAWNKKEAARVARANDKEPRRKRRPKRGRPNLRLVRSA